MKWNFHEPWVGKLALCVLFVLAGCSLPSGKLPPLASPATDHQRLGEFVWFDLLTDDPDAAAKFYGALLGWTFEANDVEGYQTIKDDGRAIGGLVDHLPDADEAPDVLWIPALSVDEVDEVAKRAAAAGGRILLGPQDGGGRGRIAIVRDPEGAIFSLADAPRGDPKAAAPTAGDFLWVQLWARDPVAETQFYRKVVGFEMQDLRSHDGIEEGTFTAHGVEVAGVIELPWPRVQPNWLVYVRVTNLSATIEKAKALGGRFLIRGERVAILQDPQGGAFAVGLNPQATEATR